MSLLGRLEDLSVTDIVQIVYLSRRTGILEVVDSSGRYSIVFSHGLIVNATSPAAPSLGHRLVSSGLLTDSHMALARQTEDAGVPIGTAILELNLLSAEKLAAAVHEHILEIVTYLVPNREGEFNFILSEVGYLDIEYEPRTLFKENGITPQKLIGTEGEKIKPLQGLEDSMRAGKALLRSAQTSEPATSGRLELAGTPLAEEEAEVVPESRPHQDVDDSAPFDLIDDEVGGDESLEVLLQSNDVLDVEESLFDEPARPAAAAEVLIPDEAQQPVKQVVPVSVETSEKSAPVVRTLPPTFSSFRTGEAPEIAPQLARVVVLLERDPLVRVAAKRAFTKRGVQIQQYGSPADARQAVLELLSKNEFFVSFLDMTAGSGSGSEAAQIVQAIKRKNRRLPAVVIDREADLRKRHEMLRAGADLYLTKPTDTHLNPGLAEEQLALFSDELVLFAERAFQDWQREATGSRDEDRGRQFYEQAEKEKSERSFLVLRQLINELSNPEDATQVTQIILRVAGEYLDRVALFLVTPDTLVGVDGGGSLRTDEIAGRVRRLRIPRSEPSILEDVIRRKRSHQGKVARTRANAAVITSIGATLPSEVVVMPIVNNEKVVGVLYGDNAEQRAPFGELNGLQIFLSQAGYAFENAFSTRMHRQNSVVDER